MMKHGDNLGIIRGLMDTAGTRMGEDIATDLSKRVMDLDELTAFLHQAYNAAAAMYDALQELDHLYEN